MDTELDDYDLTLLARMQADARTSLDALADLCGLSVASVQRRVKRLRESGVVQQEVALLDPQRVGYPMSFIVMVELERESLDQLEAFKRGVRADPQVQQCYYVTGEGDFCLICTARDMADFELLTQRLFFANQNVRRFRTSVVMSRTKVGLTVPVAHGR